MQVVLLAAGVGSRLRPITNTTPKCLVPINGKPLLDYWLDLLIDREDVSDVFINVNYLAEQVINHVQKNWSYNNKITLWHEHTLLGTAGTLCANSQLLENHEVMVVHADNLSCFAVDEFIDCHMQRPANCLMTMMLFETDTPSLCGIVELDEQRRMIFMHEKVANPLGNLANGAVYLFSPELIQWISTQSLFDISLDIIPRFHGKIATWLNTEYHRDIGTPASYLQAQSDAKNFQ